MKRGYIFPEDNDYYSDDHEKEDEKNMRKKMMLGMRRKSVRRGIFPVG